MTTPRICAECRHSFVPKSDNQSNAFNSQFSRPALFCKRFSYIDIVHGDEKHIMCRDARGAHWVVNDDGTIFGARIVLDGSEPNCQEQTSCGAKGRFWEERTQ